MSRRLFIFLASLVITSYATITPYTGKPQDCEFTEDEDCFSSYVSELPVSQSSAAVPNALVTSCDYTDYNCIRYILAENSDCETRVQGSVPNEVTFNNVVYEAPNLNSTYTEQYQIIKNLDKCYVSAFFFNPTRSRLIMGITCPNLVTIIHKHLAQHFPLQEDRSFFFHTNTRHRQISFTADIPFSKDLNVCDAFVFAYLDGTPQFTVSGDDPASENFLKLYVNNGLSYLPNYIQEDYEQKAHIYFKYWVNNVLCNFNDYCTSG